MGISKASVSRSWKSVSCCLVNLTPYWITFPSSNVIGHDENTNHIPPVYFLQKLTVIILSKQEFGFKMSNLPSDAVFVESVRSFQAKIMH